MHDEDYPRWMPALAGTALAYAAVGWLALRLALPPGYASPLYPSAGIALACVLSWGWRVLPAVALGNLLMSVVPAAWRGDIDLAALLVTTVIALGAAAQAGLGAWLVRRFVPQPLSLSEPRDIALFFALGALGACLVSASLATAALGASGSLPVRALARTWWTWWAGDTLGVLIGAPVALTLIGRPRVEWASRRLSVGLPLATATALLALASVQIGRWEAQRAQGAFERDAAEAVFGMGERLRDPLQALEAIRSVFVASDEVTRTEMQRASAAWIGPGSGLQAIGWSERVLPGALAEFEARNRLDGPPDYSVVDRVGDSRRTPAAGAQELIAIRYIEPMERNAAALGVNVLSVPMARAAVEAARRSDRPVASATFRLSQDLAVSGPPRTGVVVYRAIYAGSPSTPEQRLADTRGVVFVTLRLDELLDGLAERLPADLQLCLLDTEAPAGQRRLAGAPDCERGPPARLHQVTPLPFAGRRWELSVRAAPRTEAAGLPASAWLFSTVGLLAAALLGALLLSMTGRARRIEAAVRERTAELEREVQERLQATAALHESERARASAEASNHAKTEFLSRMSHELRTPMNAMLGFAQLLELDRRPALAATHRAWVAQIQRAGWHLLEMINDVLDLSRIEAGTMKLQPATLELPELLAAAHALVEGEARHRQLTITQDLAEGTARLHGDATRVKQILTNLLSNAVKYNTEGGRIHVASRLAGPGSVEIAVTDTGLGMTPEQLAGLFQPFNRLGRERTTEGTGIGLVISQRLAELMGGSLRARSTAGEGSSFILALPAAVDTDTVPSALDALAPPASGYHRRRVLYVEDNEINAEVMRGILAQRPQVELEVSTTGLDGLAAIRTRHPDLILLDLHLPDIDGLELLRHLKQDPVTADIPVVVVSADALAAQIERVLQAGARLYLTKPVSVAEVLDTLDQLLGQADTRFG